MKQLDDIKAILAPDNCWQIQEDILEILQQEIDRLPNKKGVSEQQCRYPETPAAMCAFLEKFFVRHFFQVQDSLLADDVFKFIRNIFDTSGPVTILDIGAGPAVALLGLLKILSQCEMMRQNTEIRIIMNDTSKICLESGQRMLDAFIHKNSGNMPKLSVQQLDIQFPENLTAIKRTISRWGKIDIFFLSYVLIPLKKELKHNEIKIGLETLKKQCCSSGSIGLILQDKFRESLARTVGYNLNATTHKGTFRQKVYDPENSNDIQTYEYYRTMIV